MKKIALVAAPAALLFALSACGDAAEEPVAEDTAMVEEAPMAEATDAAAEATDAAAEATDAAAEATDAAAEATDAAAE
jgi:hypothetical protein